MPHFLSSHIALPTFPYQEGDYTFVYEATHYAYPSQSLILVHYKNEEFLLRKAQRPHKQNWILKCEKSTKSLSTGYIKNALKILCSLQEGVISHNLHNNTPRQNLHSPFFKKIDFFLSFSQECLVEIGFGSGRHLLHFAQSNPELICIGVEIHTPSIEQILRQIELLGLKNLYIINCDARILLEILPPHIVHSLFVHFPVPWNKKPHRRVFSKPFLNQAMRVLQSNGFLHLRSDDEIYFQDALKLALELDSVKLEVRKNHQDVITSKYEARWERAKKDIYDLKIFQASCLLNHEQEPKNSQKPFQFDKILRKNLDNYANFPYKKIEQNWFLHIDALYRTQNVYVLALYFGDFNQPQSKFLQIDLDSQRTYYIGGDPIPTQATIKAHMHLIQILTQE